MSAAAAPIAPVVQPFDLFDEYVVEFGDITINFDRETATRAGHKVSLNSPEFELLRYFVQNPGKALTRDEILESVWSYVEAPSTRTVDAHVMRLRQKLERQPDNPQIFQTVHKVGYRFMPDEENL